MKSIPYPHPGEILSEEFLIPMGISSYRLSKSIKVPQGRVGEIIAGKRSVSADTAIRLSKFFGTTPNFWLNLQSGYDLAVAEVDLLDVVSDIPSWDCLSDKKI